MRGDDSQCTADLKTVPFTTMTHVLYQVFVSSTFADLREERLAVLRAIAGTGHIPTGMEDFPATSDPPWDYIKRMIELSDYYVLIIAARYGSITEEGISYTEKEYELACELEKPVLAFLHADPGSVPSRHSDADPDARSRLDAFKAKLNQRHGRKTFTTPENLATNVLASLMTAIKQQPAVGWVKANGIDNADLLKQVAALQSENAKLKQQLAVPQTSHSVPEHRIEAEMVALSLPENECDILIEVGSRPRGKVSRPSTNDKRSPPTSSLISRKLIDSRNSLLWPTPIGWQVIEALRSFAVLRTLAEGSHAIDAISRWAQIDEDSANVTLQELETDGRATRSDDDTWLITSKGRTHLAKFHPV